jgi:nitrile hydratase
VTYTSHADLGGKDGFGPVVQEPEALKFHAAWEPHALALTLAMGATGTWNIDMTRSARETLADYDRLTYYAIWLKGLEKLIVEHGLAERDEIAAGRMLHSAAPLQRVLNAHDVPETLARGTPTARSATTAARIALGERVRTRAGEILHHTRLPHYARGKIGVIDRVHGAHVFADTNARGLGEQPQWLYTVVFDGHELWGSRSTPNLSVSIDAWEPYLEPLQ